MNDDPATWRKFGEQMSAIELTQERQSTHGDFAANAEVSQDIKVIMRTAVGWVLLSDVQKEALDMIALKISRVLSGKSNHADHWNDIQGYAELAKK